MPRLVQKSSYLKPNESSEGYMKYIATREGVEKLHGRGPVSPAQQKLINSLLKDFPDCEELFEYEDYKIAPSFGTASAFITMALDYNVQNLREGDKYMKYIATRPRVERRGDHGLFGHSDYVSLPATMKELEEHQGNVWTIIYSLRREDATRLDYDSADSWRKLLLQHETEMANAIGIKKENFRWYAAFHDEGHHPHIHMMIWSRDPKEGYLTTDGIAEMRSKLTNTIFKDEMTQLYEDKDQAYQTLRAEAHTVIHELVEQMRIEICASPALEEKMSLLVNELHSVTGKKSYGYMKKPVKAIVDDIVDELAKHPRIAKCYDEWNDLQDAIYGYYKFKPRTRLPLSQQKEFRNIKNMVIREAENIRLGVHTFEDDAMDDEPEVKFPNEPDIPASRREQRKDSSYESTRSVYDQARDYQKAKKILLGDDASVEERDAAVDALKKLWDEGYSIAAYLLGKLYRDGRHVLEDHSQAEVWLRYAANAGNEFAQYALGKLILSKDTQEAIRWLETSSKQGNQYAQYTLGKIYLTGKEVPKDVDKAIEQLRASANSGNQYAQYTLGKLYLQGSEVQHDKDEARSWFEKSAAQGNQYAQFFLNRMDENHDPSIFLAATKLLHHMSKIFCQNNTSPPNPLNPRIDSKRRRKLQEKRMALGHKRDDHEEQLYYQQSM